MTDARKLKEVEDRIRSTICSTVNFRTGKETVEGRITKDDFEYLLALLNDIAVIERERCASLFESVDPASGKERAEGSPGADAMGAVLEFRDMIRGLR